MDNPRVQRAQLGLHLHCRTHRGQELLPRHRVDLAGNASSYASTSATRTGTIQAPVAPSAPGSFTAKLTSANVPVLTWSAATGAASYTLTRATDANGTFSTVVTGVTATTFTDSSAPAKATVYYRLTAVNSAGASAPASTSIAVPGDNIAPKNPSGGKATVLPAGGMQVTWTANTDADLAGYVVLKRNKSLGGYFPFLGSAENPDALTNFSDLTVAEGTVAYFRIFAVDASGNLSESYNAVTANNPNVKPKTPTSLRVTQDPSPDWRSRGRRRPTTTWPATRSIGTSPTTVLPVGASSTTSPLTRPVPARPSVTPARPGYHGRLPRRRHRRGGQPLVELVDGLGYVAHRAHRTADRSRR